MNTYLDDLTVELDTESKYLKDLRSSKLNTKVARLMKNLAKFFFGVR